MSFDRLKISVGILLLLPLVAVTNRVWAQGITLETEHELLAVLRSEADPAEKAVSCKKLAIVGSGAAAPELAKLLADERLASWARIALEAIPGSEVDEALRDAAGTLQGNLLVGVINSIGVRRDEQAVKVLATRLESADTAVATAAAAALGCIGNEAATQVLRTALVSGPAEVRSAVAEGCILCAEQRAAQGDTAEAIELFDQVRGADVPQPRVIESTRGAILARGQEGIPLLLEQLRSADGKMFQLGLSTAREFPGDRVDEALGRELAQTSPARAALLVQAMADRPQTVHRASVLAAASGGPPQLRIAAIQALGQVGDTTCLPRLLAIAQEEDNQLANAAKASLARMPGDAIDWEIKTRLADTSHDVYPLLLEVAGRRRINARDTYIRALDDHNPAIRRAALLALGETVGLDELEVLISQLLAPAHEDDATAAREALHAASIRMPDREACAAQLASAVAHAPAAGTKIALLETLAAVGGSQALASVAEAAAGEDLELQDAATRLLGKWMTPDAAPVLLELATNTTSKKYHVRAVRGYIRIARQFNMARRRRAEMCRKALEVARRPAEQKMALEVLVRYPCNEALEVAQYAVKKAGVQAEAAEAVDAITRQLEGG